VSKVSYGNGVLLFHVGEEWSLVVDLEIEDTVLIWELEARGVDCRGLGGGSDLQGETVERGQHGEFKLDNITSGRSEWLPVIPGILRELNIVCL
jgi:hypothetical protein